MPGRDEVQAYEREEGDACAALPAGYKRREPDKSVLYAAVRDNLATFLDQVRTADERGLAAYVEREFTQYLSCGILSEGFARVRCGACENEFLVAFSCKNRGWCPSCTTRRAHEVAAPGGPRRASGADPPVGAVLSKRVRWHLANDPELTAATLQVFLRVLFRFQSRRAGRERAKPQCGSITFIQRFGSALQLNVHFHAVVPDGVFVTSIQGITEFIELEPPTDREVAQLLDRVVRRTVRLLRRRGRLGDDVGPKDALEMLKGISVSARGTARWEPPEPKRRCASQDGFSLHANVRIHGNDRQGMERLFLYAARGAVSLERLERTGDGNLSYRLRRPGPDGSASVLLTPLALLQRLAALVPPPRVHQVRFHGVFGPAAQRRRAVVSMCVEASPAPAGEPLVGQNGSRSQPSSRLDWAALLKRVFRIDVLTCARCGGQMTMLAFLTERRTCKRILDHLGQVTRRPLSAKGRDPPEAWLPP